MNEDQTLHQLLRELPRETARPDFTASVMGALAARDVEAERTRHASGGRLRLAALAAALVVAVTAAAALHASAERRERVAKLRAAHSVLERELAGVKALAAGPSGLVIDTAPDRGLLLDADLLAAASPAKPGAPAIASASAATGASAGPSGGEAAVAASHARAERVAFTY